MYARTIVLELVKREDNAAKCERDGANPENGATTDELSSQRREGDLSVREKDAAAHALDEGGDSADRRIVGDTLRCEGSLFDWWVLGEKPALVTVSNPVFGKLSGFTDTDPEVFANGLAKQLLDRHAGLRLAQVRADMAPSPLKKPGWFEK
jgi:hypothetical protein